jgi:molybdopterin-guanine dinucleotide biosynthesis protein A
MGTDKAKVDVGGVPMIEKVSDALAQASQDVVILGREYTGFANWPDQVDAKGPLSGIATALNRSSSDRVLVVAVDHPFVDPNTLSQMVQLETNLAVVPVDEDGIRQVTCAIYPVSIAEAALEEANANGSIQSLLDRVSFEPVPSEIWRSWGEDGRSWFSADTPDDLARGLDLYA